MLGDNEIHREPPLNGNCQSEREALYLALLECIPAYVISKNRDGRCLFVNQQCAALFGKTPDEITGMDMKDLYTQPIAEAARNEDEMVMHSGQVVEDMFEDTVDGETFIYASRKGPLRNTNGDVLGVAAIFWDVTKRRTGERALLAEREELRVAKQAAVDAIRKIEEALKAPRKPGNQIPGPLQTISEILESYSAQAED